MTDAVRTPGADGLDAQAPVPPGAAVNVQRAGNGQRVGAEVLGAVPGAYIALRDRRAANGGPDLHSLALRTGDTLIVRLLHAGVVFGFRIAISRVVHEPEFLLFATYPRQVERVSVRKQPRLTCAGMPCRLSVGEWDTAAVLVDISVAGCGVLSRPGTEAPFQNGDAAALSLQTPECADMRRVDGRIRRTRHTGPTCAVGISFTEEQPALLDLLAPYLAIGAF